MVGAIERDEVDVVITFATNRLYRKMYTCEKEGERFPPSPFDSLRSLTAGRFGSLRDSTELVEVSLTAGATYFFKLHISPARRCTLITAPSFGASETPWRTTAECADGGREICNRARSVASVIFI